MPSQIKQNSKFLSDDLSTDERKYFQQQSPSFISYVNSGQPKINASAYKITGLGCSYTGRLNKSQGSS